MNRKRPDQRRPFALEVEHLPPTAQQAEGMGEGLPILAARLVRRHGHQIAAEPALTSASTRAPLSGTVKANSGEDATVGSRRRKLRGKA